VTSTGPKITIKKRGFAATRSASLTLFIIVGTCVTFTGCPLVMPSDPAVITAEPLAVIGGDAESRLRRRIDLVLDQNLTHRRLAVDQQSAWQIMHGVLAYGRDFTVDASGQPVNAVDYVLAGGFVDGLVLRSGDLFDADVVGDAESNAKDTRGIRADLNPGTKLGQGHRDQWLAYLAACELPEDQIVQTIDGPRRLSNWLRQIEWDVPMNFEREYSWTLMSLVPYRTSDHRWTARDGQDYSIESLLKSEVAMLSPSSACGGSHRLTAIAIAVKARRDEGKPMTGTWADAALLIETAMEQAIEFRSVDGTFSSQYFERPGRSLDLAVNIGATGHTLEFFAVAAPDELLATEAITRAANRLCEMLEQTATIDLECGALYHAISGLQIYRRRLAAITASS